jgi:YHS domain-containing protein
MAQDLVCEARVDPQVAMDAGNFSIWMDNTYYFCSKDCKAKFDEHPAFYAEAIEHNVATDEGMPLRQESPPPL